MHAASGRTVSRRIALAAVLGGGALTAGCQSTPAPAPPVQAQANPSVPPAEPAPTAPPRLTLEPGSGSEDVRPDRPVVIRASQQGQLEEVRVTDRHGRPLPGSLQQDGAVWRSTEPLAYGASYSASARARNALGSASVAGSFHTLEPEETYGTSISPLDGDTVGVGMPIVVRFPEPVDNPAEVERGLEVTTSRPVTGSWSWVSDTEVHYRPEHYWPAYTDVTLHVRSRGVEASAGSWGEKDRTVRFTVGPAMVSHVDAKALRMTVTRDGRLLRTVPVTTGKKGFTTRSGIKVVHEKFRAKIMDASTVNIARSSSEYYRLKVPYALRVTWSGEFVHGAPWSEGQQGRERVSHGCVGMSEKNARWFFDQSSVGDVIEVVGTDRPLEPGNGWTDWNVPWSEWQARSAL